MAQSIQFGGWYFDPDSNRLVSRTTEFKLQPRVARLLEYFLNHSDEVLSHDHLINAVWEGRIVSDDAVRRAVSSLRHALAVDGSDRFIKTITRKGYRAHFPVPDTEARSYRVEPNVGIVAEPEEQARSWHANVARRGRQMVWATALLLFLVLLLWAVMGPRQHLRASRGIATYNIVGTRIEITVDPRGYG